MTKTYKLLIDSPEYINGTEARWNDINEMYDIYSPDGILDKSESYVTQMQPWNIENRPNFWELQEEKLDLRSPEAEKMREEARSKRWDFVPKNIDKFFFYNVSNNKVVEDVWCFSSGDTVFWNMGNCHRTNEEALAWGEKYARYFLTE